MDVDVARGMRVSAKQGSGDLGAAGADQARESEDLTLLDLEGHVVDGLDGREVLHAQDGFVGERLGGGARVRGDLATDHHLDDLTHGRRGRVHRADVLAITQDRDAVGELGELGHAVRDEDQAGRRAHEVAHQLEERLGLGRGQRSRGLVHDQDLRIEGQRARDFHHLQACNR